MSDIFEKVKDQVKIADVVERFGVKLNSRDKGLCPFHREKTPSFSVDRKTNIFTCFGCGETGDVIKFVEKIKEVEPYDAAKFLAEMFNITVEEVPKSARTEMKTYLKKCMADIGQTDYFKRRGLTDETIKKFCLGYDMGRHAVVIPYSSKLTYYQTRSVIDKKFFKPKTEDAGPEPIFNGDTIAKVRTPIFVVESPICALSIMQCGAAAVSLCGVGNVNKLLDLVHRRRPLGPLIICLDNDEAGAKATKDLEIGLVEEDLKYLVYNIAGDCKDPNELLMKEPTALAENIDLAIRACKRKYATLRDSFNIDDLMKEELQEPTWVVQNLVQAGLIIFGAPSKSGKSWMMLQLCMAVASGKEFLGFKTNQHEVLYYALEDTKFRLKERITAMMKGKTPPSGVHFAIQSENIGKGLASQMEMELKEHPKVKLIIFDTFQKVRNFMNMGKTSAYQFEYGEMDFFKNFADAHDIAIILVHHARKQSDEGDLFNTLSGSVALMGGTDAAFVIKKKRNDNTATFGYTGRAIENEELVISFNDFDKKWEVQGSSEEMERRRAEQEYENSPLTITVKELVKRNPITGWRGSATDLMKAIYDITGQTPALTPDALGKLIKKYETRLYRDKINHSVYRAKSREHEFKKVVPYIPQGYQRTIYDDKDD